MSTEGQEKDGTSLTTQEEACRHYAEENGYIVLRVVSEARSGATLDRPGLDQIRDVVKRREIGAVICYDPDQLSRGGAAHMLTVLEECQKAGVKLLFVTRKLENSDEGKLMFSIYAAFADYERTKISERTRRGKRQRAREGRVLPGKITYGYRYVARNYAIHESEAEIVRTIFDMCARQHMSTNAIANRLTDKGVPAPGGGDTWIRSTVFRMLTNEAYKGLFRWGKYESIVPRQPLKPDPRNRKRGEKSAQRRRDVSEELSRYLARPLWTRQRGRPRRSGFAKGVRTARAKRNTATCSEAWYSVVAAGDATGAASRHACI